VAPLFRGDIAELKRLRAENAGLRMERDVLQAIRGPVGEGGDEASVAGFIADQRTNHRASVGARGLGHKSVTQAP
jgi:hypothetical protein